MRHLIYGLVDPREPEHVRYIGRSSSGHKRPRAHGGAAKLAADPTYKGNWIRSLLAEGIMFDIVVLEVVNGLEKLNEAEQRWITEGFACGWRLTNLTTGGDGSYTEQSAEFRQRRAEISRQIWSAKKHTPETIEKLRALKLGIPRSEETKAKIREACNMPEARAKMSAAARAHVRTPEHQAKLNATKLGYSPTEETRARMSAAQKARRALHPVSAETREKIAAAKQGRARPDLLGKARPDIAEANRRRTGIARPDVAERNRQRAQKPEPSDGT